MKERTGAKHYAETGSDPLGKAQGLSVLQMGSGKSQNGRELYRQAMPGRDQSKAISHVAESPGKAPSAGDFTSPEC